MGVNVIDFGPGTWDHAPVDPELPVVPGQPLGKYQIDREVGRGGMGVVYRAYQPDLKRTVAIKILLQPNDEDRKRFLREAEMAARLAHPNIAPVYEVGEDEGRPFLAMAFIDGVSISRSETPLQRKIEAVRDVARAVQHAHAAGIVHRDIKPDNIMIDRAGRAYIMDFGLARTVRPGSSLTMKGVLMGTPSYMSPEQVRGGPRGLTPRSDIYSLGATLYELLCGMPPFIAEDVALLLAMTLRDDPVPPRQRKPGVPADLETICLKAMAKSPTHRYATAGALADDLDRWLKGEPILARRSGPVGRLTSAIRRRPVASTIFLAVVLGGGVGGAFLWGAIRHGQAVERERDDEASRLKRARPHFDRGMALSGREAVDAFSEAISAHPAYGDAYHMRARARLGAGDPHDAIDADFAKACALNATSPSAFQERALFTLRERILARLAVPVLPYDPRRPPVVSFAGVGPPVVQQELKATAEQCLQTSASLGVHSTAGAVALAIANTNWGLADQLLAKEPSSAEKHEWTALVRVGRGLAAEALVALDEALKVDQNRATSHRLRAGIAGCTGRWSLAIEDLTWLIAQGGGGRDLHVQRGWMRVWAGQPAADDDFKEALVDDSVARLGRAVVRWWRGERMAAAGELYAIKGQLPAEILGRFAMMALGDDKLLREYVDSKPTASPRLAEARAWLAKDRDALLKVEDPDPMTLWALASAHEKRDDVARYNAFRRMTELWPAACRPWFEMGCYCVRKEMVSQAREFLARVLTLTEDAEMRALVEAELKKVR